MPKIFVEISDYEHISVEEFLECCDDSDIEDIVKYLSKERPYFHNNLLFDNEPKNLLDKEWDEVIQKLSVSRRRLTNEEEELIKNIANKF